MARKPTTYWDYIRVESLLGLQGGLEENDDGLANDEVLFITVHQIDELWFKLAIRELVSVRALFSRPRVPEQSLSNAARGIRRVALLFHQAAGHFALMETMTTRDYLGFRDKLSPASGFQSAQLREIEILLGLDESARIPLGHEGSYMRALRNPDGTPSPASIRVERRLEAGPSLRDALDDWLFRTPIDGSTPDHEDDPAAVSRFVDRYLEAHRRELDRARGFAEHDALTEADRTRLGERYGAEAASAERFLRAEEVEDPTERHRRARIRAALVLIEGYRDLPLLAWPRQIIDGVVELEQAFVIFRQRHARMVERMIGRRTGTGGSAGVEYLDQTALRYRVFHDIWAVRTLQIRRDALPSLAQVDAYGLAPGD